MANQKKRSLTELPKEIAKSFKMPSHLTKASKKRSGVVFGTWFLMSLFLVYVGFLFGAVWVEGEGFETLFKNFVSFYFTPPFHIIVGTTAATPKFCAAFIGIWTLFYLFIATQIKYDFRGEEYGNAHWEDADSFSEEFANHDPNAMIEVNLGDKEEEIKKKYPKLQYPYRVNSKNYWLAEGVYVNIDNDKTPNLNTLIVGPPGTGKTFRVVKPILSNLSGNFVVTDPKNHEICHQTGQYFEDNGYEVMVFDIESEESMANSIHFNPFKYIRNESEVMSIASILMKSTTDPNNSSSGDAFFEQTAEVVLTALIYLIVYYYPEEQRNWKTFVGLLNSTTVRQNAMGKIENYGMPIINKETGEQQVKDGKLQWVGGEAGHKEPGILAIMTEADKKWKQTHLDPKDHFPGYTEIEKLYNGAAETTSSVVASLDAHCRYMKLQCVQELLSDDDIQITKNFAYCEKTELSPTGKRILFICTNENQRYFDWIASMVYSIFFDELYHITSIDPWFHETLPIHLTFLMDEFANITLPSWFVDRLSTMRSRNMNAMMIVQTLIQLKQKYPENDQDHGLIGNCSIISILGAPDQDSCEYLSKMFGTQTIHKETTGNTLGVNGSTSKNDDVMEKPLFSAEEMYKMKKDGPVAILVKGADGPLYEPKVQFQNSPLYSCLCRYPYYQPKKRVSISEVLPVFEDDTSFCLVGNEIDEFKENVKKACKEANTDYNDFYYSHVTHLSAEEFLALTAEDDGLFEEAIGSETPFTREQIIEATENYKAKQLQEKKETLDFSKYTGDTLITVQKLRNQGFSPAQINTMDDFLLKDAIKSFEEITELFNPNMSVDEIEMFIKAAANNN